MSNTTVLSDSSDRSYSIVRSLQTSDAVSPLVLRLTLALVMFPHGAQKLFGWWGGFGYEATMGYFTEAMGLPWIVALSVVLLEFFAPVLLLLGMGTRFAALGLGGVMLGAMFTVQIEHGFFMNWFGNQAGEGIEYTLLILGIVAALVVSGAGRCSVDRSLTERISDR